MGQPKTTFVKTLINDTVRRAAEYIASLLGKNDLFTGRLELNFKDGKLMDINETRRTKIEG